MKYNGPLFILAGNGPYENRGCEAIVRGTAKILRKHFEDPRFICISYFNSQKQYQEQCRSETDDAIIHLSVQSVNKKNMVKNFWKIENWVDGFYYVFNHRDFYTRIYREMLPYLDNARAVLSVGGDNYSLDYGMPTRFTALDDLVIKHHKPVIIWGASVGPFGSMPDYEVEISNHLKRVTGIFSRETATTEYLNSIGVQNNVFPVADPAFVMDPIKPAGIESELPIEDSAIGLNLSPLMAKYVTAGNMDQWINMSASIIESIIKTTEHPVYLIPHVTTKSSNDFRFMQQVVSIINDKKNIKVVSEKYNAAETKWIISQMTLFAGARTHSTIAALSSSVPTLSFAYSIKAMGINRDIFGHTEYCLNPDEMSARSVSTRITSMLDDKDTIRRTLNEKIPGMQQSALDAGNHLKILI